jgi:hypothetical protein
MASRALKIDPKKGIKSLHTTPGAASPAGDHGTGIQTIEARAYELWLERGCPIGSPEVDWFQAEEELSGESGGTA